MGQFVRAIRGGRSGGGGNRLTCTQSLQVIYRHSKVQVLPCYNAPTGDADDLAAAVQHGRAAVALRNGRRDLNYSEASYGTHRAHNACCHRAFQRAQRRANHADFLSPLHFVAVTQSQGASASIPKAGKYLLDTSAAAEILRGRLDLKAQFGKQARFYLRGITMGELYYGALVSVRPEYQQQVITTMVSGYRLLALGRAVQQAYAQIKQFLRRQGTPLPENDVWIAAFAVAYRLPLLTRD